MKELFVVKITLLHILFPVIGCHAALINKSSAMPGKSNTSAIDILDDHNLAMFVTVLGCFIHLISEQNTIVVLTLLSEM